MVKKKVSFFIFLLGLSLSLFIPGAKACEEPEDGLQITEDTVFCEGEHYLSSEGMSVISDNLVIECDDTVIEMDVEPGEVNEEAFAIENRENITIKNCELNNFQIGILLVNSNNIDIINNEFKETTIGIYFAEESFENTVTQNYFHAAPISLGEENKGNSFKNNTFNHSSFGGGAERAFTEAEERSDNTFINNEYYDTEGPGEHETDYIHNDEEEENGEEENGEEENGEEESEAETFTREGSGDPEKIMQSVYEAKGLDERNIGEDIRNMEETLEKVDIVKNIKANYEENTTSVNTTVHINEDIDHLQVFEEIPKDLAPNAYEDIEFHTEDYEILKENPLIMWEFEDAEEGEEVETSYTTSRAIEEGDEEPNTTVCVDCATERTRYNFLIPLILVPIIVIGFILFERYQHKPE